MMPSTILLNCYTLISLFISLLGAHQTNPDNYITLKDKVAALRIVFDKGDSSAYKKLQSKIQDKKAFEQARIVDYGKVTTKLQKAIVDEQARMTLKGANIALHKENIDDWKDRIALYERMEKVSIKIIKDRAKEEYAFDQFYKRVLFFRRLLNGK